MARPFGEPAVFFAVRLLTTQGKAKTPAARAHAQALHRVRNEGEKENARVTVKPPRRVHESYDERDTRFELATSTLGRSHSTTELVPLSDSPNPLAPGP